MYAALATAILFFHLAIILFNVFGLIAIPLGAWCGWAFVRIFWWRALHVASLAIVVLQALFGRACFLTLWHDALIQRGGQTPSSLPLIQRWVTALIFWPLPLWVFTTLYVAVLFYVLWLWWWVPPRWVNDR